MKYTKSLLAMMLAGMTFTACNEFEDFDADANNVNYPNTVEFGYYTVENASDASSTYGVVVAKCTETEVVTDAEGNETTVEKADTVLQVITVNKEDGTVRTIGMCHDAYYDHNLGMLTGVCEVSHYEDRLVAALVYDRYGNITMQVHHGASADDTQTIVYGKAVKSTEVPPFYGTWTFGDQLYLYLSKGENVYDNDGNVIVDEEGNPVVVYGIYMDATDGYYLTTPVTVEGNVATVTLKNGTITLAYNAEMQCVATIGETQVVLDRNVSEPEPETYSPIAAGTYIHAVSASVASNVFDQTVGAFLPNYAMAKQYDAVLYQGERNKNKYLIYPWFSNNTNGLEFEVVPDQPLDEEGNTYLVSVPGSGTGLGDSSGELVACDQYYAFGYAFGANYESFDSNINFATQQVEFYHVLCTPASYYGIDHDLYMITGDAPTQHMQTKKLQKENKSFKFDQSKGKKLQLNLNPIF